MGFTLGRQETDMRPSTTFDDTLSAGVSLQSGSTDLETDMNALRSQMKRALGETNWYLALSGRDLATLSTDLGTVEQKPMICGVDVLTNVTVGGSANFAVLSVSGSEAPTLTAAIGAVTTEGAITALLAGASGTHSLNEVAGANALKPQNLVLVRDASTKDAITSGGQEIFGLLQIESVAVDGDAFDDTTKQGQISFVIQSGDDLVACPAGDIQGKIIEYVYPARYDFVNLPQNCTWPPRFCDQTASVDVTRSAAYANQSGAVSVATNADADLSASVEWALRDATAADLWNVKEGSAGGISEITIGAATDLYDNNAIDVDFASGVKIASGSTQLNLGTTAGQIDSAGALALLSAGGANLSLKSANEITFDDTNQDGSTWTATEAKLSDTAGEWNTFKTLFGEVSIIDAINQAGASATVRTVVYSTVTADAAVDVDVSLADTNVDTAFGDLSGGTFTTSYDFYLNGRKQRPNAAAGSHDLYPGTTLTPQAKLKFRKKLKIGDELQIISYV